MEHKKLFIAEIDNGWVEPVIKDEDYIFGSSPIPDEIMRADGQWEPFLPSEEVQAKEFETDGCTVFGATNQIETYEQEKFGGNPNYSDRAGYIMANIKPPGADPQVIYEVVRKQGLLNESDLPWSQDIKTLEQYASPKPLPQRLLDMAFEWLQKRIFKHEWLPRGADGYVPDEVIKEALKRSPIAVSVYAWAFDGQKYLRLGSDTHWTNLTGTYENGDWKCFDSYPPYQKRLDKNFGFRYAKRIWIGEGLAPEQRVSIIQRLIELYKQLLTFVNPEPFPFPNEVSPVPTPEPTPTHVSKIKDFALAVQGKEGFFAPGQNPNYPNGTRAWKNNSPGNFRFNSFVRDFLKAIGQDKDGYAKWGSYQDGFDALCLFLTMCCKNQVRGYHDVTLLGFCEVYAPKSDNNSPAAYADYLATRLKVATNTPIKELL